MSLTKIFRKAKEVAKTLDAPRPSSAARLVENSVPVDTPQHGGYPSGGGAAGNPGVPCPVCGGRHFWRDSYATWHCTACCSPASLAQVREQASVEVAPDIFEAGDEFPPAWRGRWAWRPDHAGKLGLERLGLTERERWWSREAVWA
jgi:hypothetical protein